MSKKTERLVQAKRNKKDEFYTRRETIDRELEWYSKYQFANKVVYCNCDTTNSAFYQYYKDNFSALKLKKLICTHISLDYATIYDGNIEKEEKMAGYGDFDSEVCNKYFNEADIISTNPPFSLAGRHIEKAMEARKGMLILANQTIYTNNRVFPFIKSGELHLGATIHGGETSFEVPDDYEITTKYAFSEGGKRYIKVSGIRWLTTLNTGWITDFEPSQTYKGNEDRYDRVEGDSMLNCNRTNMIPYDYKEEICVPITYMDKHNPKKYDIIGYKNRPKVKGKNLFKRLIIKSKT